MKRSQSGISMMGFLVFLIFVGFVAWVGMKIFPMYREYFAIKSAFKGLASDSQVAHDPGSIRKSLEKRFDIGYVDTTIVNQVRVDPSSNALVLDYEREAPLAGPFSLKGTFHVEQPLGSAVPQ